MLCWVGNETGMDEVAVAFAGTVGRHTCVEWVEDGIERVQSARGVEGQEGRHGACCGLWR